jgi:tetratricopeptide (TPR) repeat protein
LTVTLDPVRAEGFYETAIAAEPAHFDALDGLALVSLRTGDTDRAETLWAEARSRAERENRDRDIAAAEAGLGLVASRRADFDAAERQYQAALDIYDLEGDLRAAARQLGNLGYAAQGRGDSENAERFYTRALALMEEDGDALGIALARNNLAGFHRDRGDFDAAEDAYRLSLSSLEAAGDRPRTALVISNLGLLAETRGDTDSAMRFYERALSRAREYRYVRVIESTARRAGWLAFEGGEIERARALAEESLSVTETLGDPQSRADALTLSAAIAMAEGDPERAETEASAAIEAARAYPGTEAVQAYLHAVLAAAMRDQGDRISALMNTTRSRDLYLEAGDALSAAGQINRLATLSFDWGDAASGCNWLGFARTAYEEAGSAEGVSAMEERMAANGCGEGPD